MLINPIDHIKNNYFDNIKSNIAIISDSEIKTNKDFYKINTTEPVWDIIKLSFKYDFVFVVLDTLNYDNIYRLYKHDIKNVCVLNLNAWYTWIWKKLIYPDLEDIYIKSNVSVCEIMDIKNLDMYIDKFTKAPILTHIRIPDKELEQKVWNDELDMEYETIINFDQFDFSWYSWVLLAYGSLLQESINVAWLLKQEWINMDLFWIWNYKLSFSLELIKSLESHDKVFIVWDFNLSSYKDFIYSKFYDAWIIDKEVSFITPKDINPSLKDYLWEKVWMDGVSMYERIKQELE